MAENLIELKNIYKSYQQGPQKNEVLNGVDFLVKKGEFVVILGPSGSGKSTLLHLIGMLDNITSGKIIFEQKDISFLDENQKSEIRLKKIGFVFQFDSLLPEFSVSENINMPSLMLNDHSDKAKELLSKFGVQKILNKMPQELSGGEKQRVAIARALRNNPFLVLADEPTGNLDYENTKTVLEDFKKLAQSGVSVVMATHNQKAVEYGSRVLRLCGGKLTQ